MHGRECIVGGMVGGMCSREHAWQEVSMVEDMCGGGGGGGRGHIHAGEMATEAGGTHPTGMPTCLVVEFKCNSNYQTDELNAKTDVSRYFLSTQ